MIDKLSKNRFKNKCNNTGNNAYLMMFVLLLRVLKCKSNKSSIQSKVNNNTICV